MFVSLCTVSKILCRRSEKEFSMELLKKIYEYVRDADQTIPTISEELETIDTETVWQQIAYANRKFDLSFAKYRVSVKKSTSQSNLFFFFLLKKFHASHIICFYVVANSNRNWKNDTVGWRFFPDSTFRNHWTHLHLLRKKKRNVWRTKMTRNLMALSCWVIKEKNWKIVKQKRRRRRYIYSAFENSNTFYL